MKLKVSVGKALDRLTPEGILTFGALVVQAFYFYYITPLVFINHLTVCEGRLLGLCFALFVILSFCIFRFWGAVHLPKRKPKTAKVRKHKTTVRKSRVIRFFKRKN